ncbi:MAG: diaminopimelate epimerase [Pseudomonadota bacterium]
MADDTQSGLPFMKMHGLGNDFVVLDARAQDLIVTPALAMALADRHRGVGFDQLAVIENGRVGLHLSFYNADGSTAAACGNATRCVADHIMSETGASRLVIYTDRGKLLAEDAGNGQTSVNMGFPLTKWSEIPLAEEMDTLKLPLDGSPTATGMGNPHCTFFVENALDWPLESFGPEIELNPLFPERTNVQIAQIMGPKRVRVRVWERGVGVTLASGSSSCAVAVAAARRGFTERQVDIELDGGVLNIDWREDGVWMKGPTTHVFDGTLTADFLENLR